MNPPSLARGLAGLALLAAPFAAQTTHDVSLAGLDFTPAALTIQMGDTVRWTWVAGFHDVTSGVGGTPDGIFASGAPTSTAGTTFEVTFDAAFLSANPVPGNVYDYFCGVHVGFGMVGTVTVDAWQAYGACNSAPGSLSLVAGAPTVGGSYTLGVDDPTGSTPSGSLSLLLVATQPALGFPCGLPLPGYGMPSGPGDLLVSLTPPNPVFGSLGPAWTGAGSPAPIAVSIPSNPALVGVSLYNQGALTGLGVSKLTEGVQVVIGLP